MTNMTILLFQLVVYSAHKVTHLCE